MSRVAIEHIPFGASSSAACAPILAACHAVRRIVFVGEQQVEAALEWDDLDELAEHFLARREDDGTPVGTARLRIAGGHAKAERVAVHATARKRGVGRLLMAALADRAREEGCDDVVLHAQLASLPFYEAVGYEAEGPVFEEAGIDHRKMRRRLRAD